MKEAAQKPRIEFLGSTGAPSAMDGSENYDRRRRSGWARGLIHFHTKFSDGWASVLRAGEIALRQGFDFLVVTDHLNQMKLVRGRTLTEYIAACDGATARLGIPVIPGGELEVHWDSAATSDFSEAHTLALSVRPFVESGDLDWTTPGVSPFAHWIDSAGNRATILALQEKLSQRGLPGLAAHQFQHSPMSAGGEKYSDYRYDLDRLAGSRYFDFFYSGAVELIHEPEDIMVVNRHATSGPEQLKGVYSGCDFHVGPETTWPPIANAVARSSLMRSSYRWLFRTGSSLYLKLKGQAEATAFPYFAEEQLSHATYVHLGDKPCTEENVLSALGDGRTCVTRGDAEFIGLDPVPSLAGVRQPPVDLSLNLPRSYSTPRPRSVIVFRDGNVVYWEPYAIEAQAVEFTWTDHDAPPGPHTYQLYVPSKFLSSPIRFSI